MTATILMMGLIPLVVAYQLGEEGKLARDCALAVHFVFGLLLAGYAAGSALTREMRNGTASSVLSKSVSRETFFMAKFAGVAAVVALFSFCAMLSTLLSARIAPFFYRPDMLAASLTLAGPPLAFLAGGAANLWRQRPFATSAVLWLTGFLIAAFVVVAFLDRQGHVVAFGGAIEWRLAPASMLITLSLFVLAAVAITLAARLSSGPALAGVFVVFSLGLVSEFLFGRAAPHSTLASAASALLPDWQHFWLTDALVRGGTIPLDYVLQCGSYAALYTTGVLFIGMALFRHADIHHLR